jgi:MOSC domain-containing protein YiiM
VIFVREILWRERVVRTAIWKYPVGDRGIRLRGVNLIGDDQADRRVHGGPDKAVYAYAVEDYRYWADHEGIATSPGLFGENLTVQGLDLGSALIGEWWRIGTALLQVAQPRLPCFKLGVRLADPRFPKRFLAVRRLGAYLRILEEGEVRAGDAIRVLRHADCRVSLQAMAEAQQRPAECDSPLLSAHDRYFLDNVAGSSIRPGLRQFKAPTSPQIGALAPEERRISLNYDVVLPSIATSLVLRPDI